MENYLQNLNDAQKEAVLHKEGPLVLFAGAGSGKTKTITARIIHLINSGVKPWQILAVTFTNKAAEEMKLRLQNQLPEASRCLISTFHSVCARWLREFAPEIGFEPNFTIYDDSDFTTSLKRIIKSLKPNGDIPTLTSQMKSFIQMAKTNGLFPNDVEARALELDHLIPPGGIEIYKIYQEQLANSNSMDFADLLLNILLLLRKNAKVRQTLQNRFKYILVDEFQDTNQTQFEIVETLARVHRNLFVVGDDDQSIYSWRGATPANILEFDHHFSDAKTIRLEQNYRCTGNIVNAASAMIANNTKRAEKTLYTNSSDGDPIELRTETDGQMEAYWVTQRIKEEQNLFPFEDVAIFYRTNSQSRLFEEYLTKENLPYTIYGSIEFYGRAEIKDLISYFKLISNESDEVCLRRVINTPARGLGEKAVEKVEYEARKHGLTLMESIKKMGDESYPRIGNKLKGFYQLFTKIKNSIENIPLNEALEVLLEEISYKEHIKKKYSEQYLDKLENIHELGSSMAEFSKRQEGATLNEWLESVTLVRHESDEAITKGISLMTLHMAKGLEFQRVYLVGLEDGLLPHTNNTDNLDLLEEERRLLYVGMTRAKRKLTLSNAQRRQTYKMVSRNPPSRFLDEIPQKYTHILCDGSSFDEDTSYHADSDIYYQYDDPKGGDFTIGTVVFHPTFGKGRVEGVEQGAQRKKAIVRFQDFGLRKIRPSQLVVWESKFEDIY